MPGTSRDIKRFRAKVVVAGLLGETFTVNDDVRRPQTCTIRYNQPSGGTDAATRKPFAGHLGQ